MVRMILAVVVYYKPTPLNSSIVKNTPSLRMIKKFGMLPDFEINSEICVFVRGIDEYTKRPGYGHPCFCTA